MDNKKLAGELVKLAKDLVGGGDPWKDRNELADKVEKLSEEIHDISIWESGYNFGDLGSDYKNNVDANMKKLSSVVDRAVRDIKKAVNDVNSSDRK
jgi:hypothetical protein